MYKKIQEQKKLGYSISEISRMNSLDRKTTRKYYSMNPEEFSAYFASKSNREKKLDDYKECILELYELNNFQKLNMSAVFDYLEERFGALKCTEKTLRNYVHHLKYNNDIKLKSNVRMFQKVKELPLGKQMQLDFGQYQFASGLKVYIFAAVLSSSRYKYISLQEHPFKTRDVIQHLIECFDTIGGLPEEIVIDQDTTMVVSENHGDIIYTKEFHEFKSEMNFSMYVCRKADPESKGKVENLVGFVKKNFFSIRNYFDINSISEDLSKWLRRRANGKISISTGLIPEEVLKLEQEYLKPIRSSIFRNSTQHREKRTVSEKSYISFKSCLYSIPVEYKSKTVDIEFGSENLNIYFQNKLIATHKISIFKGKTVNIREHFRETPRTAKTLKEEAYSLYDFSEWKEFVMNNFKFYPRYVRDQSIYARKHLSENIEINILKESIKYCSDNQLYSFRNLYETYKVYLNESSLPKPKSEKIFKPINSNRSGIKVKTRDIGFYSSFATEKGSV
ncbi:MAG: IS21 family transposase [Leptospiraceae bacterium]|nr:IS21 family transposase [Leptospiraceae bacterium]